MALDDLADLIEAAAAGPASVTTDAGTVTSRSIDDLIKADQYLRQCQAAANGAFPFRILRMVPPGTVGRSNGRDV